MERHDVRPAGAKCFRHSCPAEDPAVRGPRKSGASSGWSLAISSCVAPGATGALAS